MRVPLLAGVAASALLLCSPLSAQRNEVDLEARPFSGSLTWLFGNWGVGAGGGIEELNRTLSPDTEKPEYSKLESLIYAQALHRWRASDRLELDLGVRAGVGDVRECTASDCWPGTYVGVYIAPMWGSRRFKIGPRFLSGVSRYGEHRDAFVYVEILTARIVLTR